MNGKDHTKDIFILKYTNILKKDIINKIIQLTFLSMLNFPYINAEEKPRKQHCHI